MGRRMAPVDNVGYLMRQCDQHFQFTVTHLDQFDVFPGGFPSVVMAVERDPVGTIQFTTHPVETCLAMVRGFPNLHPFEPTHRRHHSTCNVQVRF